MEKIEDKVPRDEDNETPLYFAALNGNLAVCKAILERVTDKNPKGYKGETPLHGAACGGHLMVYKEIVQYFVVDPFIFRIFCY